MASLRLGASVLGDNVPSGLLHRLVRDVERVGVAGGGERHEVVLVHLADRAVIAQGPSELVHIGHADVVIRVETEVVARHLLRGNDLRVLGDGEGVHRTGEFNLERARSKGVGGGDERIQSATDCDVTHGKTSLRSGNQSALVAGRR